MFGLSFGEILVVVVIGVVVLGPKRLPELMRTAGKWVTKLRRMSTDLRQQSGIDDLIRQEGLKNEIQELRSLSRINVIDTLITPAAITGAARATVTTPTATPKLEAKPSISRAQPLREREYPIHGCDAYGALADDLAPKPVAAAAVVTPVAVAPPAAEVVQAADPETLIELPDAAESAAKAGV